MSTKWTDAINLKGRSKYTALADELRNLIFSAELKPAQKLPPVRELAFQLSVTPGTVARAYKLLIEEGRCEAIIGRGTFVRANTRSTSTPKPSLLNLDTFSFPIVAKRT